jgi:predicted ArsR family transcriptional regulator
VDEPNSGADPVHAIAALDEPTRRRLYDYVAGREAPVGREEAAEALGIGRPLATFHLERLLRAGLLSAEYRRRRGRTGPGAGRPAKLYRRAHRPIELSLPARRYGQAAALFAAALEGTNSTAVLAHARAHGLAIGTAALHALEAVDARTPGRDTLLQVLRDAGYEPHEVGAMVLLRNCPFEALANDHRDLTCSMNAALLDGIRAGLGDGQRSPRQVAIPGACCVAFGPAAAIGPGPDGATF